MIRLCGPRPGRPWRGCSAIAGCRGGPGPGRVRGRQILLVQGDRLIEAARVLVGVGEAVARGQGVGVVRALDAFAGGQILLVQGDRLIEAAPSR